MFVEVQTSILQSWFFTSTNERLYHSVDPGPSTAIQYPRSAPFDDRRGYSKLPAFLKRLEVQGYQITRQARQSETMLTLLDRGISPPYLERPDAGLQIGGADSDPLFRYAQTEFLFKNIEDIPPLVVKTLLFLENRDLDRPATPWQNPVIEWDRMFKAAFYYLGAKLQLSVAVQGGSTLAVQLEKFRHSPNGRTDHPAEKLRQIVGASLKAYQEGPNTRAWRERIVVDYLNTVPLAAAPSYGEIHGLGEGLHAWFGLRLTEVIRDLNTASINAAKLRAFKHVLTLLISVRAPSVFLVDERHSLEDKVNQFTRLMARSGVIDWEFANRLQDTAIRFLPAAPLPPQPSSGKNKAANAIRVSMMESLGVNNLYDLNRLHLEVASTIDVPLQKRVTEFITRLNRPDVIKAYGLNGERMLENSDPSKVIYSFLLVESTAKGNFVRVQADNLAAALDLNSSGKLELGSTAKLRTLVHYLEVMALLHKTLAPFSDKQLIDHANAARDPLTRWAAATMIEEKLPPLEKFLDKAMERRYSGSPWEAFFTGGGVHHFENFDRSENERIFLLKDAFRSSNNLAFVRLMRDLVNYHRARLPYDADAVLNDTENPVRAQMLQEIAEEESRIALRRAYQNYAKQSPDEIIKRLVGAKANAERRLAILFFAWKMGQSQDELATWLEKHDAKNDEEMDLGKLWRAYQNPRLGLADHAYLLGVHPLDLWSAGELHRDPQLSWEKLWGSSSQARLVGSSWLLNSRNQRAQDLRLRIRIERDAFARMTPHWQKLGFPFKQLVPTYATALGSSSDRPAALAELVGILVNDGVRRPTSSLTQIHFAAGTPYETLLEPTQPPGERVLPLEVAQVARRSMAEVIEQGTARKLSGAFRLADGQLLTVGGKTGSGDNRIETFNRSGGVISSRATNRTATLVFYIGARYYGVMTAYVQGREAANYQFTSALPVTLLKLLAPTIIAKFDNKRIESPVLPVEETPADVTTQTIGHRSSVVREQPFVTH